MGSRPPKSYHDLFFFFFFFGASLALESALELLLGPTTELIIDSCHIKDTFCASQSDLEMVHGC